MEDIGVTGKGEETPETREAGFWAPRSSRALWITGGVATALAVGMLLSTVWSTGWSLRLHPLESGAVGLQCGSGFGGAVVARVEAVCAGVSVFKATVFGCVESLVTGGLGAGFLVFTAGKDDGEDVARGETGGLLLAFRAASLGECLRLGGIGAPGF